MVALYTVWYNFVRVNKAVKMAPAMASGVSKTLWSMDNIVALIDAAAPAPKTRGPYKSETRRHEGRAATVEKYPTFLQDKYRPPSKGGNTTLGISMRCSSAARDIPSWR